MSVAIVLLAFRFNVPLVNVATVAAPPTVVTPPFTVVSPAVVPMPVTPPVIEPIVAAAAIVFNPPLTLVAFNAFAPTTPPLMSLVSSPITSTVPFAIPPVIVALLPKRVLPNPLRLASVIVELAPLKFTALVLVFALLTAPRLRPVPLIVANPLAFTLSAAVLL